MKWKSNNAEPVYNASSPTFIWYQTVVQGCKLHCLIRQLILLFFSGHYLGLADSGRLYILHSYSKKKLQLCLSFFPPQFFVIWNQLLKNWQTKLEYNHTKSWGFFGIQKSRWYQAMDSCKKVHVVCVCVCVQTVEKRNGWKQLVDRDDSLQRCFSLHAQISQGFLLSPSMLVWGFFHFGSWGLVLHSNRPRNRMYLIYLSGHLMPLEHVWSGFLIQWSSADFSLTKDCEAAL